MSVLQWRFRLYMSAAVEIKFLCECVLQWRFSLYVSVCCDGDDYRRGAVAIISRPPISLLNADTIHFLFPSFSSSLHLIHPLRGTAAGRRGQGNVDVY